MSNLNGTRMRRSGCRIRTDGIFHFFLVTLCFYKITQEKTTRTFLEKKSVVCERVTCGCVPQSKTKLLTPPSRTKFEWLGKHIFWGVDYLHPIFLPPWSNEFKNLLIFLSSNRVHWNVSLVFEQWHLVLRNVTQLSLKFLQTLLNFKMKNVHRLFWWSLDEKLELSNPESLIWEQYL